MGSDTFFLFYLFNFINRVVIEGVVKKVKNRMRIWCDNYINSMT